MSPDKTRTLIAQSGFREISWLTDEALQAELERPDPLADEPPANPELNAGLLNGSDGPRMGANVARNSQEGRILPVLGLFERE